MFELMELNKESYLFKVSLMRYVWINGVKQGILFVQGEFNLHNVLGLYKDLFISCSLLLN